ncbi:hypothetical protein MMC16_002866 [Acarospora aff. strigata]|nr:hypothetical protein [Acarospora aff. strigata]
MALSSWALPHISRLLPLDDESLKQIIDYSTTLPKADAAEHLKNLLGDSPQALEFISSFNSRRETPKADPSQSEASDTARKPRKKKAPLNKLPPPRRPEDYGNTLGGYIKKDEGDYMSSSSRARHHEPHLAHSLALSDQPAALQLPKSTTSSLASSRNTSPKPPPSAAGSLISDLPNVKTSRTSSPAPKTKISVAGGTSMHGNSATINDLDSAIRALEIQTNPSLSSSSEKDNAKRRCNCNATRHPLLAAAPNCLNCGKIICVKEGIGPCTFCGRPLLSADEIQGMVRALREERGREKMEANNASHKRPDISKAPRPFTATATNSSTTSKHNTPATSDSEIENDKLTAAKQHRDKLLTYQSQNARRTRIIDEAADFETPTGGQSMWSTPAQRALQLKRQQKVLRQQEWNARPEYEKRRMVVSVDLVGGKVVRKMADVEYKAEEGDGDGEGEGDGEVEGSGGVSERGTGGSKGAFSRNPLMGGLIRPVWRKSDASYSDDNGGGKDKATEGEAPTSVSVMSKETRDTNTWRRVQDDNDDNEAWILDGGVYGSRPEGEGDRRLGAEEHAQG